MPPPEWIHNASCYTPRLLDDARAVAEHAVSPADVAKEPFMNDVCNKMSGRGSPQKLLVEREVV